MTDARPFENRECSPTEAFKKAELESVTVEAILTYRHLLRVAQSRFDRLCRLSKLTPKDTTQVARANAAYYAAIEKLDTQDNYLAKLVNRLGYVPKVNRKLFH